MPASSQAFPFILTYTWLAGSSPARITARPGVIPLPFSFSISGTNSALICRPMAVPSISLAGKTHRPGLADYHHLDLPRILQLALDPPGNLLGQGRSAGIIY